MKRKNLMKIKKGKKDIFDSSLKKLQLLKSKTVTVVVPNSTIVEHIIGIGATFSPYVEIYGGWDLNKNLGSSSPLSQRLHRLPYPYGTASNVAMTYYVKNKQISVIMYNYTGHYINGEFDPAKARDVEFTYKYYIFENNLVEEK